jgi:peptide/histidine transporter 3/4
MIYILKRIIEEPFFSFSAIGVGAVQSNMAIFGAEQIREQKDTTQYFNKYYVAVNTGCLFAFGIIAYVQQNISYVLGYSISTGLLGVTLLLFLMGYRYYFHIKPNDSVITNFFPVLINAFQTWRKLRRYARGIANGHESSNQTQFSSDQDEIIDHVLFKMNEKSISFFDYAKGTNNGRFQDRVVDDIKSLRRIIVMFLLLIPYWLIYLQVKIFLFSKFNWKIGYVMN